MRVIFTKSNSLASKAIRSITGEPVSHVAIQYGLFIIHSNFLGVHIEWAATFFRHSEVVYEIPIVDVPSALSSLNKTLLATEGHMYDFGALLYLGFKFLLKNVNLNLPNVNLWQDKHVFLCTEFVTGFLTEKPNSMITPYGLYLQLKESMDGKRNTI